MTSALEPSLYEPRFNDDWPRRSLWETAEWVNGLAFREISFADAGAPVIKIGELKSGVTASTRRTQQVFDARYRVSHGDVLYSWSGSPETSLDVFVWRGEDGWLNQHIFKVTTVNGVDKNYHIQLLRYLRQNLVAIATNKQTTGLGHVTQQDMRRMLVALPPLGEQRAIARILGSLDDKIEVNRRMNETLEAMARTLFKSWFVDFDPVRAKLRGDPPAGIDAATAALFPSRLEQTSHGEVPEGWALRPLDSVATFLNGLALQKFPAGDGPSLPVIKIAVMRSGVTAKTDRAATTIPPQYIIDDGDLLFSWSGSLDIIVWTGGRGALNQHLFKVSSSTFPSWFLLGAVRQHLPNFQAIAASKATTMGHIQRHHLTEALVAVPPAEVVAHLGRTLAPLHQRIVASSQEARTLTTLRDTLLPRLLSGELRVSDAERASEAA